MLRTAHPQQPSPDPDAEPQFQIRQQKLADQQNQSFEGVCFNSRHPGPARVEVGVRAAACGVNSAVYAASAGVFQIV